MFLKSHFILSMLKHTRRKQASQHPMSLTNTSAIKATRLQGLQTATLCASQPASIIIRAFAYAIKP